MCVQQGGVYFLVDDKGNTDPEHVLKARTTGSSTQETHKCAKSQRGQAPHLQTFTPAFLCRANSAQYCFQVTHSAVSSMCAPPPVAMLREPPHRCSQLRARAPAHAFAWRRAGQAPLRAPVHPTPSGSAGRAATAPQNLGLETLLTRSPGAAQAKHRYALLVKVRREWEVGRRVNSLLNPERAMPGYMGTGRGVVMANGHFQGARPQSSLLGYAAASLTCLGNALHGTMSSVRGMGGLRPFGLCVILRTTPKPTKVIGQYETAPSVSAA